PSGRLWDRVGKTRGNTPFFEPRGCSVARQIRFLAAEGRIQHYLVRRKKAREIDTRNVQIHVTGATPGVEVVIEHHETVGDGVHLIDERTRMVEDARSVHVAEGGD